MHWTPDSNLVRRRSDCAPGARRRDARRAGLPSPLDRVADSAATDWQIILHLKALIERVPGAVVDLLAASGPQSPAYTQTVLAAAREAACSSERADLHYVAALAAAQLGRLEEADEALGRAAALQAGARGGRSRRESVRERVFACLRGALRDAADRSDLAGLMQRVGVSDGGSGNELPS